MSSTNKTNNYSLSQYIGTDKPTYLGDYNADMLKIDNAIHAVNSTATTAQQTAGNADSKATTATANVVALEGRVGNLETSVENIKEKNNAQDTQIGTLTSQLAVAKETANNALSVANEASGKIDNAVSKAWQTCTGVNANLTATDSPLVSFNTQMKTIALKLNIAAPTATGIGMSDILCRLPSTIRYPSKSLSLGRCGINCLGYHSEGYFESVTVSEVTIDANGYVHAQVKGNSNLFISGVFAVPEW